MYKRGVFPFPGFYRKKDKVKPLALLVSPPVYDFALYDLYLKPYGLLRIGKWLEESGYEVKLVNALDYRDSESERVLGHPRRKQDGTGKFFRMVVKKPDVLKGIKRRFARYGITVEAFERRMKLHNPDVVLIGTGMTYWYLGVIEAVEVSRKLFLRVPIVIGGIYATLCEKHAKSKIGADFVVSGSAFEELPAVLERSGLPVPVPPADVSNAEMLIPKELYGDAAVIVLNEGCPFRCRYCASRVFYESFKKGNAEKSYERLCKIHDELGTENFAFYDDALLFRKEEVLKPFLEMVVKRGPKVNFYVPNGIHLSYLDFDTVRLMKEAGFREVRIGLESSKKEFHRLNDGKLDLESFPERIAMLKEAGFSGREIGVYILAGLPRQRWEEVEESIRFVSDFGVRIFVAEYSPVPGTPMYMDSLKFSHFPIEDEPLTHNNSIFPMQWEGFTTDDLDRMKQLARELSC